MHAENSPSPATRELPEPASPTPERPLEMLDRDGRRYPIEESRGPETYAEQNPFGPPIPNGTRVAAWFTYDNTSPIGGHIEIAPASPPSSPTEERLLEALNVTSGYIESLPVEFAEHFMIILEAVQSVRSENERLRGEIKAMGEMYKQVCDPLQECCQKYKLGLGGEFCHELVIEEVERLRQQSLSPEEAATVIEILEKESEARGLYDNSDAILAKLRQISSSKGQK